MRWQLRGTRRTGSRANAVAARLLTGTPTAACAAVGVRPVRSGGLRRIAPSDPGTELPPIARPRSDRVLAAPGFMPAVETRPATLPPLARPRLPLALPRTSGGSRESSVCRSSPISAWLPDLSGRLSACADPVASVRTLYIIVTQCQGGNQGNSGNCRIWPGTAEHRVRSIRRISRINGDPNRSMPQMSGHPPPWHRGHGASPARSTGRPGARCAQGAPQSLR